MGDIAAAMAGIEVQSLGGPGGMRKDHIANQTAGVASQDEEIESELASLGIAKARAAASSTPPGREK